MTILNFSLRSLLTAAYGLRSYQMIGGPDWIDRTHFNLQATSDEQVDKVLSAMTGRDAAKVKDKMLQEVLEERFGLKAHFENREGPALKLVVAKSGARMQPPVPVLPGETDPRKTMPIYQQGDGRKGYEYIANHASMKALAGDLSGQFGKDVIDDTGLEGEFAFLLQYKGTAWSEGPDDPDAWPPLPIALEKLGLKLEPTKAPIRMLVIDHAEMPSAN